MLKNGMYLVVGTLEISDLMREIDTPYATSSELRHGSGFRSNYLPTVLILLCRSRKEWNKFAGSRAEEKHSLPCQKLTNPLQRNQFRAMKRFVPECAWNGTRTTGQPSVYWARFLGPYSFSTASGTTTVAKRSNDFGKGNGRSIVLEVH